MLSYKDFCLVENWLDHKPVVFCLNIVLSSVSRDIVCRRDGGERISVKNSAVFEAKRYHEHAVHTLDRHPTDTPYTILSR